MKSPIESKLYAALVAQAGIESNDITVVTVGPSGISALIEDRRVTGMQDTGSEYDYHGDGSRFLYLYRDVYIDRYRVDMFAWLDATEFGIAIECDGHEWHDRTKQQASADRARDRALLRLNVPTIRFTGSDIHHRADECAVEILDTIKVAAERTFSAGKENGYCCAIERFYGPDGDLVKRIEDERRYEDAVAANVGIFAGIIEGLG